MIDIINAIYLGRILCIAVGPLVFPLFSRRGGVGVGVVVVVVVSP